MNFAYDEGYSDGLEGFWNNPYELGTANYGDYEDGFADGEMDYFDGAEE